jgi:signal transduction histidine kinase
MDSQLAAYGRNRLTWSIVSILATLLLAGLIVDRGIITRLQRFTRAIGDITEGNLETRVKADTPDELGVLAHAFNRMADGLKEKKELEENYAEQTVILRAQAEELATLNALAVTVGQSLNLTEILNSALDKVLELTRSRAGWISLWNDERARLELSVSRGLGDVVAPVHKQSPLNLAVCDNVFGMERTHIIPTSELQYLVTGEGRQQSPISLTCIPLNSKNRGLGVMGLAPGDPHNGRVLNMDMLTAIGRQIGIAIENARLYEKLREKEVVQRQLLERVITAQEEERKRIARELHDQTGQALSSLIMTLEVLSQPGPPAKLSEYIGDLRDLTVQILDQVHDLALELRPSVLDDLGLLVAIRHYLRGYQHRFRIPIEFQAVGLDQQRLPPDVETALYRIMQEALTNVIRHAEAHSVNVLLENRGKSVVLIVEDDGKGFDVSEVMGPRLDEKNLGLYGMQERTSLVMGTLTIESTPGKGTAIYAEVPLEAGNTREKN